MVSFPFLFIFVFVFAVLTVAGIGFLFDDVAFIWLAIANFIALLLFWIIVALNKKSHSVPRARKSHEDAEMLSEETTDPEESAEEDIVMTRTSNHAHKQQFVKYTYHHKKKKNNAVIWILIILGVVSASILGLNRDWLTGKTIDDASLKGYAQSILSGDITTGTIQSGVIVESTWEVLSTGTSSLPSTGILIENPTPTTTGKTDKPVVTPAPTPEPIQTTSSSTLKFTATQSVSLLEAVVYLLQTHNTPLLSKKDITFYGVSATNQYYKYWYTAYKLGLVGSTSSPSTLISCQTYFVLKGLLEKWDLQYTPATVKTVFFAEAQKRDLLNACVFGKILKWANLN